MFDMQCGIDVIFENLYQATATDGLRQVQQKFSEVSSLPFQNRVFD